MTVIETIILKKKYVVFLKIFVTLITTKTEMDSEII